MADVSDGAVAPRGHLVHISRTDALIAIGALQRLGADGARDRIADAVAECDKAEPLDPPVAPRGLTTFDADVYFPESHPYAKRREVYLKSEVDARLAEGAQEWQTLLRQAIEWEELAIARGAEVERLRAALVRAGACVHGEFCGKKCHNECVAIEAALAGPVPPPTGSA